MAAADTEARDRRRAALAVAYAEVTTGGRVRLTPTMSVPETLWHGLYPPGPDEPVARPDRNGQHRREHAFEAAEVTRKSWFAATTSPTTAPSDT